jgi:hypothetical protein
VKLSRTSFVFALAAPAAALTDFALLAGVDAGTAVVTVAPDSGAFLAFVSGCSSLRHSVYTVYTDPARLIFVIEPEPGAPDKTRCEAEPMTRQVFLETSMHTHQAQPHYAPSSVGALMDPAFLRRAVTDMNGEDHDTKVAASTLRLRWQLALHAIAAAFRRH